MLNLNPHPEHRRVRHPFRRPAWRPATTRAKVKSARLRRRPLQKPEQPKSCRA